MGRATVGCPSRNGNHPRAASNTRRGPDPTPVPAPAPFGPDKPSHPSPRSLRPDHPHPPRSRHRLGCASRRRPRSFTPPTAVPAARTVTRAPSRRGARGCGRSSRAPFRLRSTTHRLTRLEAPRIVPPGGRMPAMSRRSSRVMPSPRGTRKASNPSRTPNTSHPWTLSAVFTTARVTALSPGQSPPPVRIAIRPGDTLPRPTGLRGGVIWGLIGRGLIGRGVSGGNHGSHSVAPGGGSDEGSASPWLAHPFRCAGVRSLYEAGSAPSGAGSDRTTETSAGTGCGCRRRACPPSSAPVRGLSRKPRRPRSSPS